MQTFTGTEYLYIDIANQYGLDKHSWNYRCDWTKINEHQLESLSERADEPILYRKAVRALRATQDGEAVGFPMGLDATASGLQIMAVLIGCPVTGANVNLGASGNREDIYAKVAKEMSTLPGISVDRKLVKKPIMTHFYGSTNKPKQIFGEGTKELGAFYKILAQEMPGATELMGIMQACWNPEALSYEWTMPDGHVVVMKVMEPMEKKIEVDELEHSTFTHRAIVNTPAEFGLSLAANITHSVDGYVAREMVRRADKQGFQLATIHDSFWAHPNYMNEVRRNYIDILAEIADSKLGEDILCQVTGRKDVLNKRTSNFSTLVRQSEYALS